MAHLENRPLQLRKAGRSERLVIGRCPHCRLVFMARVIELAPKKATTNIGPIHTYVPFASRKGEESNMNSEALLK